MLGNELYFVMFGAQVHTYSFVVVSYEYVPETSYLQNCSSQLLDGEPSYPRYDVDQ